MVKFGLPTNPYKPIDEEISRIGSLGFDFAEICIEEPLNTPKNLANQKERILSLLRKNKLFAIGHTAPWVQFGSSNETERAMWIEEAKDMIDTTSLLEIELLNFHFFGRHSLILAKTISKMTFLENFSDAMRELTEYAKKKNIALMLENMPTENPKINGISDFSFVMNKIPSLGLHLDVAHAFIEGGMSRVKQYIEKFQSRLSHVHVHDNHGKHDEHLAIGQGSIDFESVVKWLKEIKYDRTVSFEVFVPEEAAGKKAVINNNELIRSREIFKRIWEKTK